MDIVEHSEFPQDLELAIIKSISLISECEFFGVMVSNFQLVRWLRFDEGRTSHPQPFELPQ